MQLNGDGVKFLFLLLDLRQKSPALNLQAKVTVLSNQIKSSRICIAFGLSSVLRPCQHSIGYMGDGFTGQKTQPTVSKYWRNNSAQSDAHGWASECLDVKNYKWRLNPVWHRILYSCNHKATVGVKGLKIGWISKLNYGSHHARLNITW